ncbi:hypothetical protein BY996DRAFT_6463116 [Phakopsora pachyrhizi]|nr:hypothetical protein BY996DRAFT_6463116 [Phakopsora pachyrhizi]
MFNVFHIFPAGKERQSQDFDHSPYSMKGKEMQYQEFEEGLDGLRYEGLLKQHPLRDFDTVDWAWSQGFDLSVKSSKPNRNVYAVKQAKDDKGLFVRTIEARELGLNRSLINIKEFEMIKGKTM